MHFIKYLVTVSGFLLLALVSFYTLINSEKFQLGGELFNRGTTTEKVVALTFDDGPNEHVTEILGVLAAEQVPATFFVIGDNIEKSGSAAAQIVTAGHELGNHTYSHQRMIFKSPQFVAEEIEKTDTLIRAAGYQGEILFRPPFGKKFITLPWYLAHHQRKTITWDVEPGKYLPAQATTGQVVEYIAQNTQPGSIILLHPWYGESNQHRAAITDTIQTLKGQGYRFVTVSDLLATPQ